MKKVLITGGSGLVGSALTKKLLENGYKVNWLSRSEKENTNVSTYLWDTKHNFIDKNAFQGVSCIVHLAGANILKKAWTKNYRKRIADSRIQTAQLLFEYVKKLAIPLQSFVSASATGYYGTFTSPQIITEKAPCGHDFLAKVCVDWEAKAQQFQEIGIRSVCMRTGIVLSKNGGALPPLQKTIQLGIGTPLGSGKQYMPWIHIADLVAIYMKAIQENTMHGAYNATASEALTNEELVTQLAHHLKKPLWLPSLPEFVLKALMGQRANLLLKGSRMANKRILKANFSFQFPQFAQALEDILQKN